MLSACLPNSTAIQTGQHPAITTAKNIERYRNNSTKSASSFDWNREVEPAILRITNGRSGLLFRCLKLLQYRA
jgi:hypothetical protein